MTTAKERAAIPCQGEAAQNTTKKPKNSTKLERGVRVLRYWIV